MSDGRATVLGRIRTALAGAVRPPLPPPLPVGPFTPASFITQLAAGKATHEHVATLAAVPAAVAQLCEREGLTPRLAVAQPGLVELDWATAGLATSIEWEEGLGLAVTGCRAAVMETGQFMVADADAQAWLSLVAPVHVVIIHPGDLVASLDDLPAMLGAEVPPVTTLVHGPSRTADIEQTLVLGAHGPCRVHALLVGWDSAA